MFSCEVLNPLRSRLLFAYPFALVITGCTSADSPPHDFAGEAIVKRFLTDPECREDTKNAKVPNDRLWVAARCGDLDTVKEALNSGATLSYARRYHQYSEVTALHLASQEGHAEIVSFLLRAGADPNSLNPSRYTPLHAAARRGHPAAAKLLVSAKADVNAQTNEGETPLHAAMTRGHANIVRILLGASALPNKRDMSGRTPMHMMGYISQVFGQNYETAVDLLLSGGADPNALNKDGYTPLDYSIRNDNGECVLPLVNRGFLMRRASWIDVARIAMQKKLDDLLEFALIRIDPKYTLDESGNTLIHAAVGAGNEAVLRRALAGGGDVDARNKAGVTPLLLASRHYYGRMVDPLLAAGARPDIPDNRGERPVEVLRNLKRNYQGSWPTDYQLILERLERADQAPPTR